jgi:hypothetical protein
MFCPNCGAKTSIEHKFCRACGLGLEKIALSLTEQLPDRPDENLLSEKQRLERWGMAALCVFGVGLLSIFLYGIVYKMIITEGIRGGLGALGFLILAVSGLLAAILFAKAQEAEKSASKRRIQQKDAAVVATPTKELLTEGHLEPVPSVTDRTTELLFVEKVQNKGTQGR